MKRRHLLWTLLFGLIIPFYVWYWLFDTSRRLRRQQVTEVPSLFWVVAASVLFGVVAVIIGLRNSNGVSSSFLVIYMLGWLCQVVVQVMYMYHFSKATARLVGSDISPAIMAFLFILIGALPIFLLQDKVNQWLTTRPGKTPPSPIV